MKEMSAIEVKEKASKIVERLKNPAASDFEVEVRNQFAGIEDSKLVERIHLAVKGRMLIEIAKLRRTDPLQSAEMMEVLKGFNASTEKYIERLQKREEKELLGEFKKALDNTSEIKERKSYSRAADKNNIKAVEEELGKYAQELPEQKFHKLLSDVEKLGEAAERIEKARGVKIDYPPEFEEWLKNTESEQAQDTQSSPLAVARQRSTALTKNDSRHSALPTSTVTVKPVSELKDPAEFKENLAALLKTLKDKPDATKSVWLSKYREELKEKQRTSPGERSSPERKAMIRTTGEAIKDVTEILNKISRSTPRMGHR